MKVVLDDRWLPVDMIVVVVVDVVVMEVVQ